MRQLWLKKGQWGQTQMCIPWGWWTGYWSHKPLFVQAFILTPAAVKHRQTACDCVLKPGWTARMLHINKESNIISIVTCIFLEKRIAFDPSHPEKSPRGSDFDARLFWETGNKSLRTEKSTFCIANSVRGMTDMQKNQTFLCWRSMKPLRLPDDNSTHANIPTWLNPFSEVSKKLRSQLHSQLKKKSTASAHLTPNAQTKMTSTLKEQQRC